MGELRALRWRDVDSAAGSHVRWAFARQKLDRPMSASVRSVPMADQVVAALDTLSRPPMFTGPPTSSSARTPASAWKMAGCGASSARARPRRPRHLRTQYNPIRFHDLRRTFGTIAVQAAPLSDVQAWMGHAHVQTTMIYVHYMPQHDAAERLTRVFAASSDALEELTGWSAHRVVYRCHTSAIGRRQHGFSYSSL